MALEHADEMHLLRAIELARLSRAEGNHPFGALLVDASGRVVLEAENTVVTEHDVTAHAELNLVRRAGTQFDAETLEGITLYTSTEPCAMCSGAIYWSGIGRVVFALGGIRARGLLELTPLLPDGEGGGGVAGGDLELADLSRHVALLSASRRGGAQPGVTLSTALTIPS